MEVSSGKGITLLRLCLFDIFIQKHYYRLSSENKNRLVIGTGKLEMALGNEGLDRRIAVWERLWKKYGKPTMRPFAKTDESWKNPLLYDKELIQDNQSSSKTEL